MNIDDWSATTLATRCNPPIWDESKLKMDWGDVPMCFGRNYMGMDTTTYFYIIIIRSQLEELAKYDTAGFFKLEKKVNSAMRNQLKRRTMKRLRRIEGDIRNRIKLYKPFDLDEDK